MEPFWSHMLPRPYFESDGVTLYHGDCREILPQLEPEAFDLVLTDPPYLVSYSGRWGSDWGIIEGDSDQGWVGPVYRELWRTLKPDSLCITFYGWPSADVFFDAWYLSGFRPVSVLVLIKGRWGLGHFTRAQHEQAYILAKGRPKKPQAAISDVLIWDDLPQQFHPNQKPLGAMSRLVSTFSSDGGLILDPFCGSGTTLVAARHHGRRAVGIEIEERYCELAALRLSQQVFRFTEQLRPAQQLALIQ
jgi:site-specific DNA-methyltransferase (adenine-specific)